MCGSEIGHHLQDLSVVDHGAIPADPIAGLNKMATDLPVSHAANELLPGRLSLSGELNTCLCGVVQELIVLNPEGDVPGFVVGPTVVGAVGCEVVHGGHVGSFD